MEVLNLIKIVERVVGLLEKIVNNQEKLQTLLTEHLTKAEPATETTEFAQKLLQSALAKEFKPFDLLKELMKNVTMEVKKDGEKNIS